MEICKAMYAHTSTYLCTFVLYMSVAVVLIWPSFTVSGPWSPPNCKLEQVCTYTLTYVAASDTVSVMNASSDSKKTEFLHRSGTLNPHPESVVSELFKREFFDPRDRAQVKYEMLRAHSVDRKTVAEVCRQFGFSRESFYKIRQALSTEGFSALMPKKRGRKGPTKLKGEVLKFAVEKLQKNPEVDPGQLSELITQRFGLRVHRTTVMRGVKKKPHLRAKQSRRKIGSKR